VDVDVGVGVRVGRESPVDCATAVELNVPKLSNKPVAKNVKTVVKKVLRRGNFFLNKSVIYS
jgi:hypothetical protein